jgi:hypothetical protein
MKNRNKEMSQEQQEGSGHISRVFSCAVLLCVIAASSLSITGGVLFSGCGQAVGTLCSDNNASEMNLSISVNEVWIGSGGVVDLTGEALVLSVDQDKDHLELELTEDGTIVVLSVTLPDGTEFPVRGGDTVMVDIKSKGPFWVNQSLKIRNLNGELLLSQYNGEFSGDTSDLPCEPVEATCGKVAYLPITLYFQDPSFQPEEKSITLAPGEQGELISASGNEKLVIQVGAPRIYTSLDCMDVPPTWVTTSAVRQ